MPRPDESVVAYVAVGSNVQPRRHVAEALRLLKRLVEVRGVSTFYRTTAVGPDGRARPDVEGFLNGVFEVRTALSPRELKYRVLRDVERRLGRVRTADRYAPRTIDLDVVLHGRQAVDEPGLRLPADDVARPFVALPLLELAPDLVLPGTGEALACLWKGGPPAGMEADVELTRLLKEICRT